MRCSKGVKRDGGVREYDLGNLPDRAAESSSSGKQYCRLSLERRKLRICLEVADFEAAAALGVREEFRLP